MWPLPRLGGAHRRTITGSDLGYRWHLPPGREGTVGAYSRFSADARDITSARRTKTHEATCQRHVSALLRTAWFIKAPSAAVGRTVPSMRQVVVGWALGFGLATILWFMLSPALTDEQEHLVGWLMMGAYVPVIAVVLVRARRKAHQGPS